MKRMKQVLVLLLCFTLCLASACGKGKNGGVDPAGDPNAPAEQTEQTGDKAGAEVGAQVPDETVRAYLSSRLEKVGGVNASVDVAIRDLVTVHNAEAGKQDSVTADFVLESKLCTKTMRAFCLYEYADAKWTIKTYQLDVLDTKWNEENLLGKVWSGNSNVGPREFVINELDFTNRRASVTSMGLTSTVLLRTWNTGEMELLPEGEAAPYIISQDGVLYAAKYFLFDN